eukprot:4003964-Pyramimonas_sp.AAC.1
MSERTKTEEERGSGEEVPARGVQRKQEPHFGCWEEYKTHSASTFKTCAVNPMRFSPVYGVEVQEYRTPDPL